MPAPITPAAIAAAIAVPGPVDLAALEIAFDAFVLFPAGDGLSGFVGPDHMLTEFLDGVAKHLAGDANPLPGPVADACLAYVAAHHGTLIGFTYRDAAEMATARREGFRERFATGAEAAR